MRVALAKDMLRGERPLLAEVAERVGISPLVRSVRRLRALPDTHPASLRFIMLDPAFNELKASFGCAAILPCTRAVVVTLCLPLLKVELTMHTTAKTDAIGFSISSEGPGHFAMPTKEQRQEQVAKFSKQSQDSPLPFTRVNLLEHRRMQDLSICTHRGTS